MFKISLTPRYLQILKYKLRRLLWQLKLLKFCHKNKVYFDDYSYVLKLYTFMLQSYLDAPEKEFYTLGRVTHRRKFEHLKEVASRLADGNHYPSDGQCSGKYSADLEFVPDPETKLVRVKFKNRVPLLNFEDNLFNTFWDLNKKYFRIWWD